MGTQKQLENVLQEASEVYHVLPLQGGMHAVLTQRGTWVLGLFQAPDSENLLRISEVFDDSISLKHFIAEGGWNLGGERCWIAPEIQFNVPNRHDFFGSLCIPIDVDPGHYEMNIVDDRVRFVKEIALEPFIGPSEIKRLYINRTIHLVTNPLPDSLMDGIQYAGYEQTATLKDLNPNATLSEIWNLVQLNVGVTLMIPCIGKVSSTDYFGSVPDEARTVNGNHLRIPITGRQQFKVGYKSLCMTGRMSYRHTISDGREYLLVRSFFNDPSNNYAEEPPLLEGNTGHSVHVYNDGGEFGRQNSFDEMECSGRTIGGHTGRTTTTDSFILWAYIGTYAAIQRVAQILLGTIR